MHQIHAKHGEMAATWAFYAHLLPALMSAEHAEHHWQEPAPEQVVRKFEAMSVELRKAVSELHKAAPAAAPGIKLEGREIEPGEALLGAEKYHVVHHDPNNYYVLPVEKGPDYKLAHIQRWEKKYEGHHFQVRSLPRGPRKPVVDSVQHAIPHFTFMPEQHALVHGLDLSQNYAAPPEHHQSGLSEADNLAGWMKNGAGKSVYVKKENGAEGPMREALYHNLAHQFFGLGQYVPTTALVKHPHSGQLLSVQEGVPRAEHMRSRALLGMPFAEDGHVWKPREPHHGQHLVELGQSGELDKLALMNVILGNQDRHPNNYLHSEASNPKLRLIDHGHAFDAGGLWDTPSYLEGYHTSENPTAYKLYDPLRRPLHPTAAAWASKLDPAALKAAFDRHQVHSDTSHRPVQRLKNLRDALQKAPNSDFKTLLSLIR
jgi:hypothetical protein